MPEKTLKEKVADAKKCLDEQLDSLEQHKYGVVVVRKALTALEKQLTWTDGMLEKALEKVVLLEERVEELEKERDMNRLDYLEAIYERDAEFCVPEMYGEMNYLRQKRKEAPSDGE